MKDLTITHEDLIALFRTSKSGPGAETKRNHQKLVAAFKTGINEAAGMKSWALDMLEELNALRDKQTGNARVCPGEVQALLDKAIAKARAEEAKAQTPAALQTAEA